MTEQRPGLLLLLAQAREKTGRPLEAATDYQAIYMRFALSEQAAKPRSNSIFFEAVPRYKSAAPTRPAAFSCRYPVQRKDWDGARNEYSAICSSSPVRTSSVLNSASLNAEQRSARHQRR